MLRPPDRHGNPRGRGYRAYCALPRQQQGYTRCPGHRVVAKLSGAIGSGDLVRFRNRRHGTVVGHGALVRNKTRVAINHACMQVSVKVEVATLLARSNGYKALAEENAPTGHSVRKGEIL